MDRSTGTGSTPSDAKRWLVAIVLQLCILMLVLGYVSVQTGSLSSLTAWSLTSAAVASLLYATSLSMGTVGYYTGWRGSRHGYQKQIGLLAYGWSIFYCATLLVLYPETYQNLAEHFFTADVLLGLAAMHIFSAMTLTSVSSVARHLAPATIKFILGLGFVGYAFLVMRAVLIEFDVWLNWVSTMEGFPPGRMLLSVLAVTVLLLRASIPFHRRFHQKSQ